MTRRVLMLSRYGRKGASSRLRMHQYAPALERAGFRVDVEPLLPDAYVDSLATGEAWPKWRLVEAYARRLATVLGVRRADLVWIEKELFPFLPAWAEQALARGGVPMVVDIDDAWQLRYDAHPSAPVRRLLGGKIQSVLGSASLVTAGSPYLVDLARASSARAILHVPTVVDSGRYRLRADRDDGVLRIVWVGSPSTGKYLAGIADALRRVAASRPVELVVVGASGVGLDGVPLQVVPWSEATEADIIASADIGVMPLPDSEWERGKCAYKLIQYMASGLPVVASPVGMNRDVVTPDVGRLAATQDEWVAALTELGDSGDLRRELGAAGRARVESSYSLEAWAPRLADAFREVAKTSPSARA